VALMIVRDSRVMKSCECYVWLATIRSVMDCMDWYGLHFKFGRKFEVMTRSCNVRGVIAEVLSRVFSRGEARWWGNEFIYTAKAG